MQLSSINMFKLLLLLWLLLLSPFSGSVRRRTKEVVCNLPASSQRHFHCFHVVRATSLSMPNVFVLYFDLPQLPCTNGCEKHQRMLRKIKNIKWSGEVNIPKANIRRDWKQQFFFSIYTLSDLGHLNNLIGSLSRTIQQYSPPSEWIMCELGAFPIFLENDILILNKILGLTFF